MILRARTAEGRRSAARNEDFHKIVELFNT